MLRVIGEERGSHDPRVIRAAERELLRRLGPTRGDAIRRIKSRGVFLLSCALCLVVAAVFIAAEVGTRELLTEPLAAIAVAFPILVAGLFALGGLAILIGRRWVYRGGFPWLVLSDEPAALQAHPAPEDFLGIVGSGRHAHTADEIAAAEQELEVRLKAGRQRLIRQVRGWGAAAAAVGAILALQGVGVVVGTIAEGPSFLLGPTEPHDLASVLGAVVIVVFLALVPPAGVALVVGGLALRARRDWGRRAILAVQLAFFVFILLMVLCMPATQSFPDPGKADVLTLCFTWGVWGALCLSIAWHVIGGLRRREAVKGSRFPDALGRPEVIEVCGGCVPPVEDLGR